MEVRYNCNAHRSAHHFMIAISSHSHITRKQPQRTFLQYSCSATMINTVKKYLSRKIHKLNTLIGSSNNCQSQAPNKYIVKNQLLQNNYWWLLPLFRYVLHLNLPFFQKVAPYLHIFFRLKSYLWKGLLTAKVRKKNHQILCCISFEYVHIQVIFSHKLL